MKLSFKYIAASFLLVHCLIHPEVAPRTQAPLTVKVLTQKLEDINNRVSTINSDISALIQRRQNLENIPAIQKDRDKLLGNVQALDRELKLIWSQSLELVGNKKLTKQDQDEVLRVRTYMQTIRATIIPGLKELITKELGDDQLANLFKKNSFKAVVSTHFDAQEATKAQVPGLLERIDRLAKKFASSGAHPDLITVLQDQLQDTKQLLLERSKRRV